MSTAMERSLSYATNTTTNHITTSGYPYDAAGNVTADGSGTGSHTYQWDGEGRLKSVDNGSTYSVIYDALGQAVEWSGSGLRDETCVTPSGSGWRATA